MKTYATIFALALCALFGSGAGALGQTRRAPRVLFDDFSYTDILFFLITYHSSPVTHHL